MIVVFIPHRATTPERLANFGHVYRWWQGFLGRVPWIADDPDPLTFNRGRALNAAVVSWFSQRRADNDILVLADGDLVPDPDALIDCVGHLATHPDRWAYAVPFTSVEYLSRDASVEVWGQRAQADDGALPLDGTWKRLSTGGINLITARQFRRAGGFDPRFRGWGFEDAAFDITARTMTGAPVYWSPAPVRHLWHERPPEAAPSHPGYTESLELVRRYEAADGDVEAVGALISERKDHPL